MTRRQSEIILPIDWCRKSVMPVRVAIVSDTHGELNPTIAQFVSRCDFAVHAGDVGSVDVIDQLRPRAMPPIVVRGNNDVPEKWPSAQKSIPATLPLEAKLDLPAGRLVVVHGHRAGRVNTRHQWLRRRFNDARIIVYGHSHHLCLDLDETPWVVNPGAAGRARTFGGPSLLVLKAGARRWSIETIRV